MRLKPVVSVVGLAALAACQGGSDIEELKKGQKDILAKLDGLDKAVQQVKAGAPAARVCSRNRRLVRVITSWRMAVTCCWRCGPTSASGCGGTVNWSVSRARAGGARATVRHATPRTSTSLKGQLFRRRIRAIPTGVRSRVRVSRSNAVVRAGRH